MKRFLALTTIFLSLAAMTGCSSNSAPSAASGQQQTAKPTEGSGGKMQPGNRGMANNVNNEELLSLLKIDSKTMQEEFKAGKSLADIAAEKGIPEQQVIDLLTKQSQDRTEQAIKSGKLTQDKADKMKANEQERMKQSVEHKGGFGGNGGGKRGGQGQQSGNPNTDQSKG